MGVLYDSDIDPSVIHGRTVAVMGFGAQGRAHALNLRDSGVDVVVGLRRSSPSRERCREEGLETAVPGEAAAAADVVMLLVPDEAQPALYRETLAPALRPGSVLVFAHGYNVRYGYIEPRDDLDVVMVAPLGIGDQVRERYAAGGGVPALLAVHRDVSGAARALGLAYAAANGHGRAGIIETTFADETETDLFAEQVVLCGGVTHLVRTAFETLTDAGYAQELAYFCCLHELELITDLMNRRGIAGMRRSISSTAEYGDYTRGPRVIGAASREEMERILEEIRDGRFAVELAAEFRDGAPTLARGRAEAAGHPIEAVGARLRAMMPWLRED